MIADRPPKQLVGLGLDHLPERHRQRTSQLAPKGDPFTPDRRQRHAVAGQRRVRIERTVLIQQLDPTPQLTPPHLERPIGRPGHPHILLISNLVAHPGVRIADQRTGTLKTDRPRRQRVVDRTQRRTQLRPDPHPSRHGRPITPGLVGQPRRRHRPELTTTDLAGLELTQQMTLSRRERRPGRSHIDRTRQQLVV